MPRKDGVMSDEVREWFRQHGRKGAAKSWANMTAEERSRRARKAVKARWAKAKREQEVADD